MKKLNLLIVTFLLFFTWTKIQAQTYCEEMPFLELREVSLYSYDCSEENLKKNFENVHAYCGEETRTLVCKCLSQQTLTRLSVTEDAKFIEDTYQQVLKGNFNNLVTNISTFNNFMLTKDHVGKLMQENENKEEIQGMGGYCKLQTFFKELESFKQEGDSEDCPASKELIEARIKNIFSISKYPQDLRKINDRIKYDQGIDYNSPNSCISKREFMSYRSSPGASDPVFNVLAKATTHEEFKGFIKGIKDYGQDANKKDIYTDPPGGNEIKHDPISLQDAVKDVITYNPIFNLALRDPKFFQEMKEKMKEKKYSGDNVYLMFQDKDLNAKAFGSINKSCINFTKEMKKALCQKSFPKVHPTTMMENIKDNIHLPIKVGAQKSSYINRITYQKSCEGKEGPSKGDQGLTDFLSNAVRINSHTKNSGNPNELKQEKDFNDFSKKFCGSDVKSPIDDSDLRKMTTDFLNKHPALKDAFANEDLMKKTKLKILYDNKGNVIGYERVFPQKGSEDWMPSVWFKDWTEIKKHLGDKVNDEDLKQFYVLLEMQTNKKWSDMEDLQHKIITAHPEYAERDLKAKDIYAIIQNPRSTKDKALRKAILDRHEKLLHDQKQNVNEVHKLFFEERKPESIIAQSQYYIQNGYTYAPTNGQQVAWGKDEPEGSVLKPTLTNIDAPLASGLRPIESMRPAPISPTTSAVNAAAPQVVAPVSTPGLSPTAQIDRASTTPETVIGKVEAPKENDDYLNSLKQKLADMESQVEDFEKESTSKKSKKAKAVETETEKVARRSNLGSSSSAPQSTGGYASSANNTELSSEGTQGSAQLTEINRAPASGINEAIVKNEGSKVEAIGNVKSSEITPSLLIELTQNLPIPSESFPKTKENLEDAQKQLGLPGNIYPYPIPHKAYELLKGDVVKKFPGIEGKQFKTIEATQVDGETVLYERTFVANPKNSYKPQEVSKILLSPSRVEKIRNFILTPQDLKQILGFSG